MQPIYLDNCATTMIHPEVAAAMRDVEGVVGNPASQHFAGRRARCMLEDARDAMAELLGASSRGQDSDRLIFTSGGTESNNLAMRGLVREKTGQLLISSIEHPSILGAAEHLLARQLDVGRIPVDRRGVICLEHLPNLLTNRTQLVSVMLANNETGVVQPIADVAELCRSRGVLVHSDAVQAVGKIPVHFRSLGVDALSFSAHKFHGPIGIGGLLIRPQVSLTPIVFGGFQQAGLRPGTEPVALVQGMLKALQIWDCERSDREASLRRLCDRLAERLRAGYDELVINGDGARRLPHVLNVSFPGIDRQALVMALDRCQVACSTGSACASGSSEPSPVLLAMGLADEVVSSSIRLSLSCFTTESEVDEAAFRIHKVVNDLRRIKRTVQQDLPPRVPISKPI